MILKNTTRFVEISAVVLTGLGKFILMDWLNLRFLYIAIACIGWGLYVWTKSRKNKELLAYWGFRKDNFMACLKILLPWFLISCLAFVMYGYFNNTLIISWHIIPILLLYPFWGIIQHLLMIALVAGNLKDQTRFNISDSLIILFTALLFAVVHFPHYLLVGGTFLLALVYGFVYLKEKNLWVLGIMHGWLGALFFYTVLDRDPWVEVFGRIG